MKKSNSILSILLAAAMTVTPCLQMLAGTVSFAEDVKDEVLFESSFEKDEAAPKNELKEVSGVIETAYGIKGKGLKVQLDTVSGMEDYLGSENKYNLFDGKTATKFLSGKSTGYIQFALEEAAPVNGYEIASANDEPTRDPKSWTLYGSNDGKNWTSLDTRKNVAFSGRFETKLFTFKNSVSYKWYKLDVTQNCGASMIQFSSLDLYTDATGGEEQKDPENALEVDETTITADAGYQGHVVSNLFDGNKDTKYLVMNSSTATVSFALTKETVLTSYSLMSANDHDPRDPKDWDIYGSEDGKNWVKLDSRKDEDFAARYQTNTYTVSGNTTAYKWYKLDVTSNNGNDAVGMNIVQIAEFALNPSVPSVDPGTDTPSGSGDYEVITSSIVADAAGSGHPAEHMLDGNKNTKYLVMNSTTATISFQINKEIVLTSYALMGANDHHPRDPKDWDLYGSKDGKSWVKLDSREDESFDEFYQVNYYTVSGNKTAYNWYKLDITDNHGQDAVGLYIVQLAELMLNPALPEEEPDEETIGYGVVKSSIKGTAAYSSGEGRENLFDRDEATKLVVSGNTMWVSFKTAKPMTITAYSLTSANDWPERDPKDWALYGSNDGNAWTKIDEQSGILFPGRYETKIFRLAKSVTYSYFKLDVTAKRDTNAYLQLSDFTLLTSEDVPEIKPGMTVVRDFGPTQTDTGKPGAWTGDSCLAVFGEQSSTGKTYARTVVYDGLNIPVSRYTTFSYLIFPGLFNIKSYDYEYTSCRVMLDLHFTDGTVLSGLNALDQYGSVLSPAGQVDGECLVTEQWNYIESGIGDVAAGKTVDRIDVYFEMDSAVDASKFITFFDDVKIENKKPVVYEHLSDYINILRGTNNDQAFSRGLCTPGVTMPNGFNFYTPVTNPAKNTASYNYQVNGGNNPLDSISVMHAPSYWISSYGTWQFMANTSVDASGSVTSAMISSDARKSKFTHENETANAHYYSVTLNEGTAASGVKIEVTPTSHAAYVRFTFPNDAENVNVIFDSLWGSSATLTLSEDGKSFTALTNHTSAGGGKMYVVGSFDTAWKSAKKVGTKQGIVSFAKGTTTVTMKIATSFLSYEQAEHSMDLEIGRSGTFESVFASAQGAWDDLCGKFEIEGASYTQLVTFYSNLYRMYAYPNLYSENEGTNEKPVWVYASPYHSGAKTSGILYTNNGFWDTYRTTWAGYSLFTSEKDGEMLDGIVQHYIDSGWIPRWICPGPANVMVGTSSDIIFADAYIKGIDFNYQKAWESMQKDASAYSASLTNGGRKNNNLYPYAGYVANDVGEGYSCSSANYLDDYGLYVMAKAMGLETEAEYYLDRCLKYSMMFNEEVGFFMGKSSSGVWSGNSSTYNPASWGGPKGDYTESVGWVNSFPAVYDGEGLAALYGGREALAAKLDELFDDSMESMMKVVTGTGHEICEFKEVKMGQYEHNNQPSHHLIYTYAFSSEPYKVQEYTREVLRHVYVGSEIGQGYPGDEDNGEMSAWYIFNALGFYPYCPGSGEYVIGSPLYDKVTVHLDNGKDIVIVANNNSNENVYIRSATINGKTLDRMYLTHEELTSGCTIVYNMGSTPSSFGSSDEAKPSSLSTVDERATYESDLADGAALTNEAYAKQTPTASSQIYTDILAAKNLFDGNGLTKCTVSDGASIVFTGKAPSKLSLLTLTCDEKKTAPTGVKIEASSDGINWMTLASKKDLSFLCDKFLVPVAVPEAMRGFYNYYRVTFTGGTAIAEVEFIGEKGSKGEDPFAKLQTGDINLDGMLNIIDVTYLLDYLSMSKEDAQKMVDNGIFILSQNDVDGSGSIDIADVTKLLDILAGNG